MMLPRALSVPVDRIARQTIGKDWSLYSTLLAHWPEILGAEYAQSTTPIKLSFPKLQKQARREGGTLVIRAPRGLIMELTFCVGQIRARLKDYFGYEAIERIVFEPDFRKKAQPPRAARPAPAETELSVPAALRAQLSGMENDELREALEAWGGRILARCRELKAQN